MGFEQVDDYFGITNDSEIGDDVKIWLYPIINGEEVHHHEGPFDAIRLNYEIVRNDPKTADLFEKVFNMITASLDVTPTFNGEPIEDYSNIKEAINDTIQYCRVELEVEPGSNDALELDY